MVTETDKQCELLIIDHLKTHCPSEWHIISEETNDHCNLTDEPTWIVDPIDGTTNFVHQFPYVAVSIGLTVKKQPVLGVVYNPVTDELYTAQRGRGAYLNLKKRLQVSKVKSIDKALLSSNWPYDRSDESLRVVHDNFYTFAQRMCHGIRVTGSAVCNMYLVASGALECYYEVGVQAWDVCAGKVIVEEAGGVCLDIDMDGLNLFNNRVLACNNRDIAEQVSRILADIMAKHGIGNNSN